MVMPANSTGWFWHCLARETGKIGHLFSPGAQRGPWPWFPYALDNGAFAAWDQKKNIWMESRWDESAWKRMLVWAEFQSIKPLWAIVPDWIGSAEKTLERWHDYADQVPFPKALAVQNGMSPQMARSVNPDVIAIGGTTEWKWATVEMWAKEFPRVHLLRCNMPDKLDYLEGLGVESCDGTGWNRGNRTQTTGLETFCRKNPQPTEIMLCDYVCREMADKRQLIFA